MSLDNLPFNFFDVLFLGVVIGGLLQGRKHGMSEELLAVIKWLAIVIICGMFYEPLGRQFAQASPFSLLASFLIVYVGGALLILSLFGLLKNRLGGKLIGSDMFGRSEYYLGMCSGMVRWLCMLVVVLSVLNARYFSPMEVRAQEEYQQRWFSSELFPTWPSAQKTVFEKSLSGPWIKDHLGALMIQPTQAENKGYHQQEFQAQ